jgi:predicted CXXCH cytochrome family protein
MADTKQKRWWLAAGLVMLALSGYFSTRLFGDDRRLFLPNTTSHGHYQIELACGTCHTPFDGVKQEACNQCHGEELAAVNDSHPRKKFEDPRNADRLTVLDARYCVTCHVEHQPERTLAMGVTQPVDFCFNCHAEIAKDLPSHKNYAFDGCAAGGCHNYHDNTALYEDFLVKHLNEPATLARPVVAKRDLKPWIKLVSTNSSARALTRADADAPGAMAPKHLEEWAGSAHARAGVNCRDCHAPAQADGARAAWQDQPGAAACATCHEREQQGFQSGRHGMRLAQKLSPMRPELARLPMQTDAHGRELGCSSCHGAHAVNVRRAAVEACVECHDDQHSKAYAGSPHARLWRAEQEKHGAAGSGVSCATCHLPREFHREGDVKGIRVQHNQNANLRPNEKMIRGVCMNCHGLGFSIDALADPVLIQRNFTGQPAAHIESLDLAAARLKQPRKPKP